MRGCYVRAWSVKLQKLGMTRLLGFILK